ncbi:hypothetical protein C9374_002410 [Naegleria lovaniensis]|uniref:HD/PDEase domain-containing protein n=1 Tax=Naegleria lovaniensis TaxID=51637 RepID=A0AA88KMM5_NAELO|nr:uncharacterized protein C9374_002410 [Naegleria lovaniensis]KAG2386666.1 hypothetical protein C9374_002410 [Naegleria lovaniensis]
MVRGVMSQYDASHDFHHVERVVKMAKFIAHKELALPSDVSTLDSAHCTSVAPSILEKLQVIELAAYLHDVHDHKYVEPNQNGTVDKNKAQRAIEEHLSQLLVPEDIIERVQYVVDNISYSKEVKRMKENKEEKDELPIELKVVQDSDRLDAIGVIGAARCLVFSGSKRRAIYIPEEETFISSCHSPIELFQQKLALNPTPTVSATDDSAIQHFYDKLFHLESMMKTTTGKELAKKRVQHMKTFMADLYEELYFENLHQWQPPSLTSPPSCNTNTSISDSLDDLLDESFLILPTTNGCHSLTTSAPNMHIGNHFLNWNNQHNHQPLGAFGGNTNMLKEDISSLVYVYLPRCSLPLLIPRYSIFQTWTEQLTTETTRLALKEMTRAHYHQFVGKQQQPSNDYSDQPLLDLNSLFQHGLISVHTNSLHSNSSTTLTCPSVYLDLGLSNISDSNKIEVEKAFLFAQVVENGLRNETSILNSASFTVNANNLAIHCLINLCVLGSTFRKSKQSVTAASFSASTNQETDQSALDLLIRQALSQCETVNQIIVMRRTIENLQYPLNRGQWITKRTSPQLFHSTKKSILDYIDEKLHRSFFKLYELKGDYLGFLGFSSMNALLQSNALVIDASQKEIQCYKALRQFLLFNGDVIRKLKSLSESSIATNSNSTFASNVLEALLWSTLESTSSVLEQPLLMNNTTNASRELAIYNECMDGRDYTQIPSLSALIEFSLCVLISQLRWNTFLLFDKISLLFRLYNELQLCGIVTHFDFITFYKVIEYRLNEQEACIDRKVRSLKKSPAYGMMSTNMRSGSSQGNDVPGYPSQIHIFYDSDDQNYAHALQEVSSSGVLHRMKELLRFVKEVHSLTAATAHHMDHGQSNSKENRREIEVSFDLALSYDHVMSKLESLLCQQTPHSSGPTTLHNIQTILNQHNELESNQNVSALMNSAPITQIVHQLNLYHDRRKRIQHEQQQKLLELEQQKKKRTRRKKSVVVFEEENGTKACTEGVPSSSSSSSSTMNNFVFSSSSHAQQQQQQASSSKKTVTKGRRKSCTSVSSSGGNMNSFTFIQEDGKSTTSASKSSSSKTAKKRRASVVSATSTATSCSQASSSDHSVTTFSDLNVDQVVPPSAVLNRSQPYMAKQGPPSSSFGVMSTSYSMSASSTFHNSSSSHHGGQNSNMGYSINNSNNHLSTYPNNNNNSNYDFMTKFSQQVLDEGEFSFGDYTAEDPLMLIHAQPQSSHALTSHSSVGHFNSMLEQLGGELDWMNSSTNLCCEESSIQLIENEFSALLDFPLTASTSTACFYNELQQEESSSSASEESSGMKKRKRGEQNDCCQGP